jgi:DNA ligase D-like protein (predicted ligase)
VPRARRDWTKALPKDAAGELRKARMPGWIQPQLATLTKERFSSDDWAYEPKLDGERCLAFGRKGSVELLSRNKLKLNASYPEVVEALERQPHDAFLIDGEVVAFEGERTSFSKLQKRMHVNNAGETLRRAVPVFYYVFDIVHLDGFGLTNLDLLGRKAALEHGFDFDGALRFMTHVVGEGESYYEEACRRGWEGLIAKKIAARYVGGRTRDWLKFKCSYEQEFVIVGFTEPKGTRSGLGALLVGVYEDGELRYAGKVGTGYSQKLLLELTERLEKIETLEPPFAGKPPVRKGAHWVKPRLVAQVGFAEWTPDGKLRHPRFLGLRRDKKAKDVIRETTS